MQGKWTFVVHTYMGDMTSNMDFQVDGEKLTGTGEDAANGAVAEIQDGVYKDNQFSYKLTIKTAVGEMTNELSGTVDGDTITGKSKNAMGEFDVTGTRVGKSLKPSVKRTEQSVDCSVFYSLFHKSHNCIPMPFLIRTDTRHFRSVYKSRHPSLTPVAFSERSAAVRLSTHEGSMRMPIFHHIH